MFEFAQIFTLDALPDTTIFFIRAGHKAFTILGPPEAGFVSISFLHLQKNTQLYLYKGF